MKIELKNIGKIKCAEIELKPLTIFVGKNNTGKTYATTALWALINHLNKIDDFGFIDEELKDKFYKLFKKHFINLNAEKEIEVCVLSDELIKLQKSINSKLMLESEKILEEAFKFSNFKNSSMQTLNNEFEDVKINVGFRHFSHDNMFNFHQITIKHRQGNNSYDYGEITKVNDVDELIDKIIKLFWKYVSKLSYSVNEFSNIWRNIYIPAARTGIMLNLNGIISEPFRKLLDKEDLSIPTNDFTQPTLNFALHLNSLMFGEEKEYVYLEKLLEGKIQKNKSINRYEYMPNNMDKTIPLSASSSLVTELAPIAILGSSFTGFILFEEPEAHLHLEAQREMAKFLVKMVNSGQKLLITTHSDTFLQQLNNLILLNRLKIQNKDISKFGFPDNELLGEENVAAYEFKYTNENTNVEAIECGEYGFIASSLNEVLISLSQESNSIISMLEE